jgi:hypothetical protein
MREIRLTKGQVTLVDDKHYERIMGYGKWQAVWNKFTCTYYAQKRVLGADGKRHTFLMHRVVMGFIHGDGRRVDHRDPRQTLDNREDNLRESTAAQNCWNQGCRKNSIGRLKGISPNHSGWQAEIRANGKRRYLGTRRTREEAHALYCAAAAELHGEFLRTA